MKIKEIIITGLILCFIFSISAVGAADVDADDTNNTILTTTDDVGIIKSTNDSSSVSLPENNEVLGDAGSFSDLRNDISGGGTVELTRNYTYSDSDNLASGITISNSMTIDGKGNVVIDAKNKARIFVIDAGKTVTLKGITFINANANGHGGSVWSNGIVHIENCKFINNTADGGNGGSVFILGSGSTVNKSYFEGSRSIKTAGDNGIGGAVFLANSNIVLTHSTFINNTAGYNGGAVGSKVNITGCKIINCTFDGNIANGSAGAVGMQSSNFNMYNSTFTNNEAKGITNIGNGGGIVLRGSNSYVYNCTFTGNKAFKDGGAIYLTNTTIVSTNDNTGLELCTFTNNIAGYNGGAISWVASANGGYIKDSDFSENSANRSGGAVYWSGDYGTISNTTFTNNSANGTITTTEYGIFGGGDGGAIVWVGSHGLINDSCIFTGNYANNRGGAIYLHGSYTENCTNITINNCRFDNNVAGVNGGAVDWNSGAHDGNIFYSTFNNNIARGNGGAVFWSGHNGEILHSNFTNNTANGLITDTYNNCGDGGAVIWSGLNGTVTDCRFIDNIANKRGGAVYLQNCTHGNCTNTTFSYSYFKNNTAGTNGGAIDWHEGANDGYVLYSVFEQNTAKRSGGAIYWNGYNGEIKHSNFTNNKALGIASSTDAFGNVTYGGDGGAVIWIGSEGNVDNCTFNDNEAAKRGGAVYLQGTSISNCSNTYFTNSYFKNNTAGTNGGAIDWNKGAHNGYVYNVTFINNTAKRSGGAIFWNGHNGTIEWTRFYGNTALGINNATSVLGDVTYGGDGGAVIWSGALGTVFYCNFVNNTAAKRGGAVFLQASGEACENTTFRNTYFGNNTAGTNGGAIDWNQGARNGVVDNVTFVENVAKRSGGAIFWNGYNGTVKNSNFTNNRATGEYLQYDMSLTYDNIIIINSNTLPTDTPSQSDEGKLYILNYTNGNVRIFKSYVADNGKWLQLDGTEVESPKISPKDWGLDQFFGGDGGSINWIGDIGLIENCNFIESNSARRGGAAYMTGSDYVTFAHCNFINTTSGTNGGGVDWLAGANYGKIYNCLFNNTRAARSAGAIYYDGDYGEMVNITIINARSWGASDLSESRDGRVKFAKWDSSHWDTNTTGGDGGAIMITGDHEYLYNVTFYNATSQGRGGAVFLQDNRNVTFDSCIFYGNEALGIATNTWNNYTQERDDNNNDTKLQYDLTGHGGAIAFDVGASDCVIINSELVWNYANRDGGAINIAVGSFNCTIENTRFINNSAGDDGGAINWEGSLGTVKNITCYNNTAVAYNNPVTGPSTSNGGTICLTGDNVTISDSSFTLSTVLIGANPDKRPAAGAIFLTGNNNAIISTRFDTCYSPDDAGAIKVIGNHTFISNCTFENCNATETGGVMFISGEYCQLYNSTFTNNFAGNDAGAINWEGSNGIVYNITCYNISATSMNGHYSNGGTMLIKGDNITISKSHFTMTSAKIAGGAMFITGNFVKITDSSFLMCAVSLTDNPKAGKGYVTGGGSIYLLGNYSSILNTTFARSNAKQGGVIYIQGHDVTIDGAITDFTFAPYGGGAIYVKGENTTISNSNFTRGNSTVSYGGSIYVEGANANISNSNFTMSMSAKDGGAIYVDGFNTTIEYSRFAMNNATNNGGAVYIFGDSTKILNSTLIQSHAVNGGSIYISGNQAYIYGSYMAKVSADLDGGAIYIAGNNATLEKSTFEKANASGKVKNGKFSNGNGGAIYVQGYNADIIDSKFNLTVATLGSGGAIYVGGVNTTISGAIAYISRAPNGQGGAIYINGADTVIRDSELTMAHSGKEGGSIYILGDRSKVINSTITRTSSDKDGGAVYIQAVDASIEDSHFTMNNATAAGGAIYINGMYASVKNSTFNLTFAKTSTSFATSNLGGAVYIKGDYANISGSEFENSFAYHGGVIYLEGSHCTVTNSSFSNSQSSRDGGAMYSTGSYTNVYYSNFTNNVAIDDGGAIFWDGGKSSTYNMMLGCMFLNNTAYCDPGHSTKGGGAIYFSSGGSYSGIKDCKFINNSAQSKDKADGGAILWDGSSHIYIDDSLFDGNHVTSKSAASTSIWVQGGSIYARPATNFTISNSIFQNCWSQKEAGAVYLQLSSNVNIGIRILNVTFINNTAKSTGVNLDDNEKGAGALMIKSATDVWVVGCKFINNTANYGGAVTLWKLLNKPTYIINSTFDGNKAIGGNDGSNLGGSIYSQSSFNMYNVTISNSMAASNGGGAYITDVNVNYNNLTFINNSAVLGGGLYWDHQATIQNMKFINNSAQHGGAMYVPKAQTIKYNNFTNNTATYGGALYVLAGNTLISYNNFTGNEATYDGGAIFIPVSSTGVDITYSLFDKNKADSGGAIYYGSQGFNNRRIAYCIFTNNTATVNGGAVYLANTNQVILSSYFESNSAQSGGSVYVGNDLTGVKVQDSTFKYSKADNGGAVYNGGASTAATLIINDTFIGNTAVYNGGAIYYITNNGANIYRDYNNFEGIGIIDSSTKRTDVYTNATNTHIIQKSLFENNTDYLFEIMAEADLEAPVITVTISSPTNVNRRNINVVINLTNATTGQLVSQVIINPDNFFEHYNEDKGILYATFTGLVTNTTYNITVGFSNYDYLYKGNSTQEQARGDPIGDFQLLQRLIERNIADGNYEIHLPRTLRFTPYYNNDTGYPLDTRCINITHVTQPLTIYGDGWVIDARGFSRIFNITAANVTFIDVEFANGNASGQFWDKVDKGGGIYWSGVNGTLIGCNFYNNHAYVGGGIYYDYTALNAKIFNTSFVSNNADTNGGAIDCNAPAMGLENTRFESNTANIGAALCREVNATGGHGYNNTFIDNHASYAGAALAWINASSIHIDTYFFYDNTAGYSGGAIYVGEGSGNCEIENCVFSNNYIDNNGGHGGAIEWYAKEGYVSNSIFTNNHAHDGGAIYVGSESGKINITSSTFKQNYALAVGGAISLNASSVTINESNFYDNKALEGGALYVSGEGETNYVYNSVFEGNNATAGNGGAINWMASSGTIIASNLTNNNGYYGGGIYFGGLSSESVISKCIFTNNHAKYNGGAIDCNASRMNLTHTIFDGNYAQFGAALCREINAQNGSGENNTFKNNHAWISGAALGWMGSVGIKIVNYTFINNSADVSGGAIYASPDSHNCSIIDCDFEDNYVTNRTAGEDSFTWTAWDGDTMQYRLQFTTDMTLVNKTVIYDSETLLYYNGNFPEDLGVGGAINILSSNATVVNTKFTGNYARLGGALYIGADSGNTKITNDIFTANTAYERGGAVNLHASAVNVSASKFYDNIAIDGAALYVGGVGTNNIITDSVFEGNNATGYGAGVYWIAQEGVIDNTNFTNNRATYGGGIFFNGRSANTDVTNSIFKLNNATKNGGAIECNASNIGIYNLTFDSNYAGEYGAALCRESGATGGHGTNNTFTSNHAGISGAALAWLGVKNIHIYDYTFIDNTAFTSGGAIYAAQGSDNCLIDNCTFEGNHLTNMSNYHFGGAIDCVADNMTIHMSSFKNNGANTGGAIYAGSGSNQVTVSYSNFIDNYAVGDGGAIGLKSDNLDISYAYFKSNTAGRSGGAVYAGGTGKDNSIVYAIFEDNTAGYHGGAIDWLAQAGEFKFINFTQNSASYGGAIYLNGISSNSIISNVIFTGNRASKNGGAIDCNASYMGLNNTMFISNYAGEYGAALCREANATGGFGGNNTFIKNHADIAGAALAWLGVDGININNYTFINNTAGMHGGAIFVREDSPNCKVRNSYFELNYAIDLLSGRGGTIDWLGANGYICNSTFTYAYALEGGTLYIGSDNMTIADSNFSYSISLQRGGVILARNASNAIIDNCTFFKNIAAGYLDQQGNDYGQGGAICWINSDNITISNSQFNETENHADGTLYFMNCNNSGLYNITIKGSITIRNGGSLSWSNSSNITMDSCDFLDTAASYNGGALFLNNVDNVTVRNSNFNNTSSLWGNGGAIYIKGNATFDNNTYIKYDAYEDYAGGIYVHVGNVTISNSTFIGPDTIWVSKNATSYIYNNNITGPLPNKDITYLDKAYDSRYNKYDYSVWNDGNLYLGNNTFDYIIFNNGTIKTQTYTYILDNKTINGTWMENFTFWATINDDNLNTIISVKSLNTTNDMEHGWYPMPYNALKIPIYYQGVFHIGGMDSGLEKNTVFNGTLYVLAPTAIKINITQHNQGEHVIIQGIVTKNNMPFTGNVTFQVGDETYSRQVIDGIATLNLYNLTANAYTVTALYPGDLNHFSCENSTLLIVRLRQTWINIVVNNIHYGQLPLAIITTNGNGTIMVSLNGRTERYNITNGRYELPFDTLYDPGTHYMSVVYLEDAYYSFATNQTNFTVSKVNTTINVVPTNITYGENEIINVTLDKNTTGYLGIIIPGYPNYVGVIVNGTVNFNISGLAAGTYTATALYPGDIHYNGNSTTFTFKVGATSDYLFDVKVDPVEYGKHSIVRVLVPTDAKGNVTIYVDGVNQGTVDVINGTVALDVGSWSGGDHIVNVTYNGDVSYAPKDKNATLLRVEPTDDWNMRINGDYKPYGENTTFTITVDKDLLVNNVTIKIDGIPYVVNFTSHVAVLTLNNLSAGRHEGEVIYEGDANYAAKSSKFFPTIPKATPTITLTQDGKDVIATVSGNTTGNVTFYIGYDEYTVNLTGRTATLVGKLDYGVNVVSAIYNGDDNYNAAEARETFTVDTLPSLVNVTVSETVYGNPVEILVQVGEGQSGSVKIIINGNTYMDELDNGQAKFYINGLTVKEYTVNVTYNGNHVYSTSVNSTKFNVTEADLSVDMTALNVTVEESATFIIHSINSDFHGNVNITVTDDVNYDDAVKTLITMGRLPAGKYTANVTFYGDNNYKNRTLKVNFTVSRVTPKIDVEIADVTYPNNAVANINIANNANGTVNITIGTQVFEGNVTNGVASVDLTGLSAGVKEATVEFFTTDKYNNNVTSDVRFIVNQASSAIGIAVKDMYMVGEDIIITLNPVNSTGAVTVTLNGEDKPVVGNKVTFTGGLGEGTYTIIANLAGNDNYASATNSTVFHVVKNNVNLTIDVGGNAHVGDDRTVTVTLNATDATGDIIFSVNNANYVAHINYGVAELVLNDLENITYTIKALYYGDEKYLANESAEASFNVLKNSISLNVTVDSPITLGGTSTVTITMAPSINATVTLTLGNGTYNRTYNVVVINGVGKYDLFGFENDGTYDVNVTFAGDKKYLSSKNATQLVVNKVADYNLDVYVSDINKGDNETILIVLPDDADHTKLIVKVNGNTYDHIMANGFATVIIPGLDVGEYEVNVTYLGDDKYGPKDNNSNIFNVKPAVAYNMTLEVDNKTYGDYTTITVTVPADVDNNVTITIDGVSYSRKANSSGVVTLSLNNLVGGLHLVTAIYSGDDTYEYNSRTAVFTVERKESSIDVKFITPANAGEGVLFNISMGQKINGVALLTVGEQTFNVVLTNGNGSQIVYGLMNGNYDVKVEFAGNENYTNSASSIKQLVVNKATATVSLSDVTIEAGQVAIILIAVTDGATGIVNVTVNGITQSIGLIDSRATVYVPDLRNGTYPITVKYGGDDKHFASENTTQHIYVNKVANYQFNIVAIDTVVGGNSTVTVYMPGDANGNITIAEKTAKVVDGKAVIVLDKETVSGEKHISVAYGNDTKYADRTGVDATYNVDKARSNVEITVDNIYVIGDNVTITLTTENGTAAVTINGNDYALTDNQITFTANATGQYTVVATIEGNDSYYGSGDIKVFNIIKASSSIGIDVKDIYMVGENIEITLTPVNSTGTVSVTINGKAYDIVGNKVYANDLSEDTYNIVATLAADDNYEASTGIKVFNVVRKNLTVTLSDVGTIYVGSNVTFTATLNETATGNIIFNINGVYYLVPINGQTATYTYTPVNNATLNVIATYVGFDKFNTNSSALKQYNVYNIDSLIRLSDVTIEVGEIAKIMINVTEGATGVINVTVNGETQSVALVDSKATVFVSGLTNVRDYPITVKYLGDDKYSPSQNTQYKVIVNKITNYDFTVIASDTVVGGNSTVTVYMPGDANGNITIAAKTAKVVDGMAVIVLDRENFAGGKQVTVYYGYDSKYADNADGVVASYNVDKAQSSVEITVNSIYVIGDTVEITLATENGTATVKINDNDYTVVNNRVTFTANVIGTYTITATINSTDDYYGSNDTKVFNIIKASSAISIGVDEVYNVGDRIVITLTPSNSTGNINVSINGQSYTVKDNTVTIENGLSEGTYTVIAELDSDSKYESSNDFKVFNVVKNNLTIVVEDITGDIIVDSPVTFTASLSENVTGDVIFTINSISYIVHISDSNQATYTYTPQNNETLTVFATFMGNDKYNGKVSESKHFNVDRISTSVIVTVSNITVGDVAVVNITVINATSGNLSIEIGTEYSITVGVVEGTFTIAVPGLTVGDKTVNVTYNANDRYLPSNATYDFNVGQSTKDIIVVTQNITYGDNETVVVYIDAVGSVTLTIAEINYSNTTEISDGKVRFIIKGLAAGNYTVNATFNGNVNLTKNSIEANFTVSKAAPEISVTLHNITYYDTENIIVNVNTNGKVTIKLNGTVIRENVELTNGGITVPLNDLGAGIYPVEVIFKGNANYTEFTLNSQFTVFRAPTTVDFEVTYNATGMSEMIDVTVSNVNASGKVTIIVNGVNHTADVINGHANITVDRFESENNVIVVIYDGDSNLTGNWTSKTFGPDKLQSNITILVTNVTVDDTQTVKVYVPDDAKGFVIITVDGVKDYYCEITNLNYVTLELTGLVNKTYTVFARYTGDGKYNESNNTASFNVAKVNTTVDINVLPITYGENANITVTVNMNATGYITIRLNNTWNTTLPVINGKVTWIVSNLAAGNYTVYANFTGNSRFNVNDTETVIFEVRKATPVFTIDEVNVKADENATIIIRINSTAEGDFNITVNGKNYPGTISDGVAEITIDKLDAGKYNITAVYSGDDNYNNRTVTFTDVVIVGKITDYPINVTALNITVENSTNITVYVPEGATGKVFITVDGITYNKTVTGTSVEFNIPGLKAGAYFINATLDDVNYENRTAYAFFTVSKLETGINIDVGPVVYVGDNLTVTITLPSGVLNNVTIEIDGVKYSKLPTVGVATFEIEGLSAGIKTIAVTYIGDDKYEFNSTTANFTVSKRTSQLNITSSPIDVGGTVQINVTGPDDITGIVIVKVNKISYAVILTDGEGSVDIPNLANGTYDIIATYWENDKYLSSVNDTEKVTVSKIVPDIKASVENIILGENAVFEITLPDDATGTVTINMTGITVTVGVTGGVNRILVENIPIGEYDVDITYNGNNRYLTNSARVTLKVGPASIKDGISVEDLRNGTVIVHVPENATGNVTITISNRTFNATVENASAVISLNGVIPGTYNATVYYSGDENNTNATLPARIVIDKLTTPISVSVDSIDVGGIAHISVTVPVDINDNVTIEIDGVKYNMTATGGIAAFEIANLTAGLKTVTAIYNGDEWYSYNATTAQFSVNKQDSFVHISVSDADGGKTIRVEVPAGATGYVILDVDGKEYGVNLTQTGEVTIPITRTAKYTVNATYLGDDTFLPSNNSTSFYATVGDENVTIEITNITVGNDLIVKVTVPDDANGTITVRIGNETIIVDAAGGENIIKIPGLTEGVYDVNVTYSGDDTYDSKTVREIIYVSSTINSEEKLIRGWDSPYDYYAEFLDGEGHVLKDTYVEMIVNGKTYTVKTDNEGIAYLTDSHLDVGTYEVLCINPVTGQQSNHTVTIVKRLIENKDITMDFNDGTYYVVKAIGDDGQAAPAGEYLAITVNGIKYASITDDDGYARLKINLNPKTYTVTAEYKNTKVSNKLVVKQTLKLVKKTVNVKKGKKLILKAKLKWSNAKAIRGKVVKFKFNGKTYKAKTNSKGIAKVTVKSKVTKKLKKGKKYAYSATYINNIVRGNVKVK